MIIGIVGGIASGKSMVADMLAELGAVVLCADRTAHKILDQPEVRDQLVARWGRGVLASDGQVDRSAIARVVFGPDASADEEREFLESVVHPLVLTALKKKQYLLAKQGLEVFVIDAPLLMEAGWESDCDCVLFVESADADRLQHAEKRGWAPEELEQREAAQMPLATKRHRADVVIDNSGDIPALREQIEILWRDVVQPQL